MDNSDEVADEMITASAGLPHRNIYPSFPINSALFSGRASKVIWLSGFSGSGKSTLARLLIEDLANLNYPVFHLDGDDLRNGLCRDLGFSDRDRYENIRRAAEVANLLKNRGLTVISSFITPLEQQRSLARSIIGNDEFILVHVKCSLEECSRRDPKGLYRKAKEGSIEFFTGISSAYEAPSSPSLEIDTEFLSLAESRSLLLSAFKKEILHLDSASLNIPVAT